MSIIDAAFTSVNKVSVRRLADGPRAKAASALAALLETRAEVLTSIHIVIQLILVVGAVFVFSGFERRHIRYAGSVTGTVIIMMFVILLFGSRRGSLATCNPASSACPASAAGRPPRQRAPRSYETRRT